MDGGHVGIMQINKFSPHWIFRNLGGQPEMYCSENNSFAISGRWKYYFDWTIAYSIQPTSG